MTTKYKPANELLSGKTNPIIEIFFEYVQLKNLYRQGWLDQGVSKLDCETVAEHCFGVALLGYTIATEYRPDLDSLKVMRLGMFHELGEIYAGDLTPRDNVSSEEKTKREFGAVKKVFSRLPNPEKYIEIWLDFEQRKSPEAQFVKQIDMLELALQTLLYERMNYKGFDEFYSYVKGRVKYSPEVKAILDEVINLRK